MQFLCTHVLRFFTLRSADVALVPFRSLAFKHARALSFFRVLTNARERAELRARWQVSGLGWELWLVLRSTFIIDGPLALRSQRLAAPRDSATGRDMAARLAGGFIAPVSTDVLYPAIQSALAGGGFKDIASVAAL